MKSTNKTSVLIWADFDCTTGFGNVTNELVTRWAKMRPDVNFVILAINNWEPQTYDVCDNVSVIPWHIMQMENEQQMDHYLHASCINFITQSKFDAVFMINDLEVINPMTKFFKEYFPIREEKGFKAPKMIMYFPIDSKPLLSDCDCLDFFDEIATYTEYGKTTVLELMPHLADKLKVVPHGVDTEVFFPLTPAEIKKKKEKLFGKDKYVVGSVNRNSARKDIGTTVMAFKEAFRGDNPKPNAVLYLHMNPVDPFGLNLFRLCDRLGLEIGKDVFFPQDFSENKGLEPKQLNWIYNTFDVFLTTTTAEGWGLTVTEAMACKIPVISPVHTSLNEILGNGQRGIELVVLEEIVFIGDNEKIRFKTPIESVAVALEYAYKKDSQNVLFVESAYQYVSTLPWENTATELFNRIKKHLPAVMGVAT